MLPPPESVIKRGAFQGLNRVAPVPRASQHQIVFTFPTEVTYSGAAFAPAAGLNGTVNGTPTSPNAIEVTVNLTGVSNAQTGTVTLMNVNDGATTGVVVVPINFLVGDTNADGAVCVGPRARGAIVESSAVGSFWMR